MTTTSNTTPNGLTTPLELTPTQAAEFRAAGVADPAVQAYIDRDIWNEANRPTPPACPQWCTEKPGHQFEVAAIDATVWTRQHTDDVNDQVTIVQVETFDASTGAVEYQDPFVSFWVQGNRIDGDFSPMALRELMATLVAGVEQGLTRVEQVTQ